MNSYTFTIVGSYFLFIALFILIAGITIYTYQKTIPTISNFKRNLLISLRIISLTILLFLIFNPILNITSSKDIPAKVSYFIDNSQSILGLRNENKEIINNLLNELESEQDNIYKFDTETIKLDKDKIDSLIFNGNYTNISSVLSKIASFNSRENNVASVIITDGNYNQGRNPLIDIEYATTPIYIIGVGDTVIKPDLAIYNILTNKIAYINSAIPIDVSIEVNSTDTGRVDVVLYENNNPLDTIDFNVFENQKNYNLVFEYIPKTSGNKRITVKAISNFDEENIKNNQINEFIKVLDDKKNICLISGSSNVDLSFIVRELESKSNINLSKIIQKKQSELYNVNLEKELVESQLIILNNFPNRFTDNRLIERIKVELKKGKPLFYMFGPDVDVNKLKLLSKYLPFEIISHNPREFQVQANLVETSIGESVIKFKSVDESIWNDQPTIFKTETFVKLKPSSKMLLNLKMNNNVLNEAMLISSEVNGAKVIASMCYGLYRWKLLGYAKDLSNNKIPEIDVYVELLNNILKWLSIKDNESRFVVNTNKKIYSSGESVEFNAQLYDDSYNPLNEAEITVSLEAQNEKRDIILTSIGNGKYKSNIGGLGKGSYSFKANAVYKNKNVGPVNDIFDVGDTPLEFLKTDINKKLLEKIAEKSGGKYYHISKVKNINDIIDNNVKLKSIPSYTKEDVTFRDKIWLLIIPILLLSLEWFIRKRSSLL